MVWLPNGEKMIIYLDVSTQYRRVTHGQTDRQLDRQTSCDSTVRTMHGIAR